MAQPVWNTPSGSLGVYPATIPIVYVLSANPVLPSASITFSLLSGSLPNGLSLSEDGVISGIPSLVVREIVSSFAVRITDNYGNIRDRTFSMTVNGSAAPKLVTPPGPILTTIDSVWIELPIQYNNPEPDNKVIIRVLDGALPPGLEINEQGLIRGYPAAPLILVKVNQITTTSTSITTGNVINCLSTAGFVINRPVVFSGTLIGGLQPNITYYVKSVINSTSFTISATPNGPTFNLSQATGVMIINLPATNIGEPTVRTYNFALQLMSLLGDDIKTYSITVQNQNATISQGGPGKPKNTRIPVILNTRPSTFDINDTDPYYGYYVLPPVGSSYDTYPPDVPAFMGVFKSGSSFAFKIIGKDFDQDVIRYAFSNLPSGLAGNTATGWITGNISLANQGIYGYGFGVSVYKATNPTVSSPTFNFSFDISNTIMKDIVWVSPSNLGILYNGTVSTKNVLATADVDLQYRVVSGSLPPNLSMLDNGEITGYCADQPTSEILNKNAQTTFTFTVQAYSPEFSVITSEKEFTMTVVQRFAQPTDILYMKATPSIPDREIIDSLLTNDTIIPTEYLYRPNDVYFGKATDVTYEHAYGIYASDIEQYLASVTKNHYWRNITLGELKTAVAKNELGEVIYEVVYSQVIDNLVNPEGVSVDEEIYWPRPINLNLGPWIASATDVYTSFIEIFDQSYYTSLTPGYARSLYPNSLYNMRTRVGQELGLEPDNYILPAWMTSQQSNGSTLGFTQAWVIAYTKPYIIVDGQSLTYAEFAATGKERYTTDSTGKLVPKYLSYSEIVKNNIETMWPYKLNIINFRLDRFSVNKTLTYDFNNNTLPNSWNSLPSGTPVPDPLDSKDFYVLFPQKTILPNKSQY